MNADHNSTPTNFLYTVQALKLEIINEKSIEAFFAVENYFQSVHLLYPAY